MMAKKYGWHNYGCRGIYRRRLFRNLRRKRSLYKVTEFFLGMKNIFFEVSETSIVLETGTVEEKLLVETDNYNIAWELVRDPVMAK